MARNVAYLRAPIERVFGVLADPESYADWVVGAHAIRGADADWPAVGSKFHHRVGIGPFKLDDNSQVLEVAPPERIVLQARARPLGTARVTIELLDQGEATRVTMTEGPGDRFSRMLHNRLVDWLLRRRNDASLRRLAALAEASPDAPRHAAS